MSSIVFGSAPNWYNAQAGDYSPVGHIYAYGSKDVIALLHFPQHESGGVTAHSHVRKHQFWVPKTQSAKGLAPMFVGELSGGHKRQSRVTGVSFLPLKSLGYLCVSTGTDGQVVLWDTRTKTVLDRHLVRGNGTEVTCVATNRLSPDLVLVGDSKGSITMWYPSALVSGTNEPERASVAQFNPVTSAGGIMCVSLSHHNSNLAVVGYRSGIVVIVDVCSRSVRQRLPGHDETVHSVHWHPSSSMSSLIVSTAKDQRIVLWDAGNEVTDESGRLLAQLTLPPTVGRIKSRASHGQVKRLWFTSQWLPNSNVETIHLITSSFTGDLLLWEINHKTADCGTAFRLENVDTLYCESPKVFAAGHTRPVFTITSCFDSALDSNWIISLGMDREIRMWNLKSLNPVAQVPTLGGHVYAMDLCPSDPTTVAVGVGDNSIRVWYTQDSGSPFHSKLLWRMLQSKVSVVKWHPLHDDLIAYGTDDGHVGVAALYGNQSVRFKSHHANSVSQLQWLRVCDQHDSTLKSPSTPDDHSNWRLYSGDGVDVLEHDIRHPNAKRTCLQEVFDNILGESKAVSSFSWSNPIISDSSNGSDKKANNIRLLALGQPDGTVLLLVVNTSCPFLKPCKDRRVSLVQQFYQHSSTVTALAWYADTSRFEDEIVRDESILESTWWLASGSTDTTTTIYQFTTDFVLNALDLVRVEQHNGAEDTIDSLPARRQHIPLPVTTVQLQGGHTKQVVNLAWEPAASSQITSIRIATTAQDGTVQIWNAVSGEPCGTCSLDTGAPKLLFRCAIWMRNQNDVLLTGGSEQTIRAWNTSQLTYQAPQQALAKKQSRHSSAKQDVVKSEATQVNESTTSTKSVSTAPSPDTSVGQCLNSSVVDKKTLIDSLLPRSELDDAVCQLVCSEFRLRFENLWKFNDYVNARDMKHPIERRLREALQLADVEHPQCCHGTSLCLSCSAHKYCTLMGIDPSSILGKVFEARDLEKRASEQHSSQQLREMIRNFAKPNSQPCEKGSSLGIDSGAAMLTYCGDLGHRLEILAREGRLTAEWVSLSPAAGIDVWRMVSEAYARQLVDNKQFHAAAAHLVSIGKVNEAVHVLSNAGKMVDAIVLARLRLGDRNSVTAELKDKFASMCVRREPSNWNLAVIACLSLAEYGKVSRLFLNCALFHCNKYIAENKAPEGDVRDEIIALFGCSALFCTLAEDGSALQNLVAVCAAVGDCCLWCDEIASCMQYISLATSFSQVGHQIQFLAAWMSVEDAIIDCDETGATELSTKLKRLPEVSMARLASNMNDDVEVCLNSVFEQRKEHLVRAVRAAELLKQLI